MRSYFITWEAYNTALAGSPVGKATPFDHGTSVRVCSDAGEAYKQQLDHLGTWHQGKRCIITSITVIEETDNVERPERTA